MCGRYVSVSSVDRLAAYFEVDQIRTGDLPDRYNVAPTLDVYSVIQRDGERRLGTLRWGLVPWFSKDPKKGPAPINARVETIADKPMFRDAFARRRCLLPADGFYEWRVLADRTTKQPYFIHHPDDEPLAFAGVWGSWRPRGADGQADREAEPLYSTAILTTAAAGSLMPRLHDRMPVVLPESAWDAWLAEEERDPSELHALLDDLGAPELDAYPITTRVNNVRHEGPDLLEPAPEPDA